MVTERRWHVFRLLASQSPQPAHRRRYPMTMSDTKWKLLVTFAALVLLSIPCIYTVNVLRSLASFSDAYASDWTSTFVIDHLRTSGDWPRGWDD